jgi:hypothetical protein
VWRFAAVALLLLTAAQLFGCALGCEMDDDDRPGHCLCCCRHLAVPALAQPAPAEAIEILAHAPAPERPSSPVSSIYHPPRA